MGAGIAGIITIEFTVDRRCIDDLEPSFLECYDFHGEEGRYILKFDFFMQNFKNFSREFNDLLKIDDKEYDVDWEKFDLIDSDKCNVSLLEELFSSEKNGYRPSIKRGRYGISVPGLDVNRYIVIYFGSYKAYLETYNTFSHMELLTVKALKIHWLRQ